MSIFEKLKKLKKIVALERNFLLYLHSQKKRRSSVSGCDVIGSHARLRIWCCEAWGFESLHPHHFLEIFVAFTSTFLRNIIAKIAQLVEHDLAKVGVAGSNPVFRSTFCLGGGIGRHAGLKILCP